MYKWQLRQRKSCLTQEELVKAYEGPDFDLADRYGEVRRTTSFTYMLTRWLAHPFTRSLARTLTPSLTHSLTHSLTLSLTHSLPLSLPPTLSTPSLLPTQSVIHLLTHLLLQCSC